MVQISTHPTLVVLCVCLGVAGISSPALAGSLHEDDVYSSASEISSTGSFQDSSVTTSSNDSDQPRHKDPSQVQSEEELAELEQWMANRLSSRLGNSTVHLSQGEYKSARSVVGDEYNNMLSKYVDVSGRTDSTADDTRAKKFKSTKNNQQEYANHVSNYRQTYNKYQQAKQNGNDKKARTLARQLENSSNEISKTGNNLTQNYQNLSDATNTDFTSETKTVREINENISHQQEDVRAAEFSQTDLSAEIESDESSFVNPVSVTGELVDENGTALANETIQIQLGSGRVNTTTTDADGDFTIIGRPAVLSVGLQSVTVRHLPNSSSIYLGSNETVETSIQQTRSTISISQSSKQARYGKPVAVSGSVNVDSIGVDGVPVVVKTGSTVLGRAQTNANGTFSVSEKLPASVRSGKRQIQVVIPLENRAVTATPAKMPLNVNLTPTSLNITGQALDQQNISVHGNLTTVRGTPVPNRTIVLQSQGTNIGTVTTDENGSYDTHLRLPGKLAKSKNGSKLQISASYADKKSNLAPSKATTTIQFDTGSMLDGSLLVWGGIAGLIGFVAIGGFAIQRSDWLFSSDESDDSNQITNNPEVESETVEQADTTGMTPSALSDRANTALQNGDFQVAIEAAYAAARQHFLQTDEALSATGQTHWEFYRICQGREFTEQQLDRLHELTQLYEQATFSAQMPSRESAQSAIDAVSLYDLNGDASDLSSE